MSGSEPESHPMMRDFMQGKEGSVTMVNCQGNPQLYIKKGQIQRGRILNGSNARFYKLSIEGRCPHESQEIESMRRINRDYPNVKVLILILHKDSQHFRQASLASGKGHVAKDDLAELIPVIKVNRKRGVYIPWFI